MGEKKKSAKVSENKPQELSLCSTASRFPRVSTDHPCEKFTKN